MKKMYNVHSIDHDPIGCVSSNFSALYGAIDCNSADCFTADFCTTSANIAGRVNELPLGKAAEGTMSTASKNGLQDPVSH